MKKNLEGQNPSKNLPTAAVKDNKKYFYKYINGKRMGMDTPHSVLDV